MRQLAWLSSSPKSESKERESRREQIDRLADEANIEPDYQMPEIGELAYLVGYLSEIGEAQTSGGSMASISWRDLSAWSSLTGLRISPIEYNALRTLSRAYVAEFYRCDGNDAHAPVLLEVDNSRVEKKLTSLFAMMRS